MTGRDVPCRSCALFTRNGVVFVSEELLISFIENKLDEVYKAEVLSVETLGLTLNERSKMESFYEKLMNFYQTLLDKLCDTHSYRYIIVRYNKVDSPEFKHKVERTQWEGE